MAPRPAERTRTPLRLLTLEDLMDIAAPDANGVGPNDALNLMARCEDDVGAAIDRLETEEAHAPLRRYLLRRGLVSVVGKEQ